MRFLSNRLIVKACSEQVCQRTVDDPGEGVEGRDEDIEKRKGGEGLAGAQRLAQPRDKTERQDPGARVCVCARLSVNWVCTFASQSPRVGLRHARMVYVCVHNDSDEVGGMRRRQQSCTPVNRVLAYEI